MHFTKPYFLHLTHYSKGSVQIKKMFYEVGYQPKRLQSFSVQVMIHLFYNSWNPCYFIPRLESAKNNVCGITIIRLQYVLFTCYCWQLSSGGLDADNLARYTMLAEVVLGQTDMALFLLITSGGAQNKAFLSGFYELHIRGSYRRGQIDSLQPRPWQRRKPTLASWHGSKQ